VLDHLFWRRHLNGDRSVIGRTIRLGGSSFVIIGVAGRDFEDPGGRGQQPSIWAPLATLGRVQAPTADSARPHVMVLGRLAPGASKAQVDAELTALLRALPPPNEGSTRPATGADSGPLMSAEGLAITRLVVGVVLSLVALVIVIGAANVSNLLLAGAATRRRELGVRLALGASRRRLLRQLAMESLLLSGAGALVGLVLAGWLAPVLAMLWGTPERDTDPDARVYAFVVVGFAVSAFAAWLAPVRFGLRADPGECLKGTRGFQTAGSGRLRSSLVSIQAAASIVLIVLAALLMRSVAHVAWRDPGYDVPRLLGVSTDGPFPRTDEDRQVAAHYWRTALTRVRALPAVDDAALVTSAPFGIRFGSPDDVQFISTDANYFQVTGIRVLRGRTYAGDEVAADAPVAVINYQVARRFWGSDDPVGASLERMNARFARSRVIGVVADAMTFGLEARNMPTVYVPLTSPSSAQMVVRSERPGDLAVPVRAALDALAPDIRSRVWLVEDRFAREFERPRRYATLAAAIAGLALSLAVVGLVGVTAFVVRTRTREIGVRMALGARSGQVVASLVRDGIRPVVVGLGIGVVAALLAGRLVAGLLYDVSARDPVAMGAGAAILLTAALTAILLPARRAAHVDPAQVLREG
jgi:predicted permease